MNNTPVLLTRGDVTVRGTRMGLYGGVLVHDPAGVMHLPETGFGNAIWSSSPSGPPCWAELHDDAWNRLGWTITPTADVAEDDAP